MGNVHGFDCTASHLLKTPAPVSRGQALAVSAGLSVLFLVVYCGCLSITARRHHVGVLYFQWEHAIPFVSFFVLPYLSIDLFFVAAPFLFRDGAALRVYCWRIVAAILVAGVFFLLFPLRFAFPRPLVSGWLGLIFNWFRGLDAPFNLFPSLHAALLLLLAQAYWRHLRGLVRGFVLLWFFLIALSPVLTRQHHLLDVIGGFLLAAACWRFIREPFVSPEATAASKDEAVKS